MSAILAGRRAAERNMLDTFTAYTPSADPTVDADGMETQGYTTAATTRGKITGGSGQTADTAAREVRVGGVLREVVEGGLHLPVTAAVPVAGDVGVGWEYELTSAGPTTPSDLLNSRWLVVNAPAASQKTARRLDVVRLR